MKHAEVPTAFLLTHDADERRTLRAALMGMNVIPEDMPLDEGAVKSLAQSLRQRPRTVAIINLRGLATVPQTILGLERVFNDPELRKRVLLTRHGKGHVWESDRKWVQRLGFCGLLAEVSPASLTAEASADLHEIAALLKITPLPPDKLAACFVGSEAVSWLASQYSISREISVALGLALQQLDLVHHVVHEQAFADAQFFYRTTVSSASDRLDPGNVFKLLRSGTVVEIRDRMYRGKTYPDCLVGAEAIDWLCTYYLLKRHDAEIFLNRVHGFGLIHHVTDDHLVRDDYFFYHLTM